MNSKFSGAPLSPPGYALGSDRVFMPSDMRGLGAGRGRIQENRRNAALRARRYPLDPIITLSIILEDTMPLQPDRNSEPERFGLILTKAVK